MNHQNLCKYNVTLNNKDRTITILAVYLCKCCLEQIKLAFRDRKAAPFTLGMKNNYIFQFNA
jgi:hypothetical protein